MKKLIKIVAGLAVAFVLIVIAAVLALPLWIGPAAKIGVNQFGPGIVKTTVHLGDFGLNPYAGSLRIGDFQVWNPPGYSQKMAFTLGQLSVDVEPSSVLSDVVHIKSIRIKDVFASYIGSTSYGLGGTNNIKQILANVKGEDAPRGDSAPTASAADAKPAAPAKDEPKKSGYLETHKVIIDLVEINGVLVQIGPLTTPVPVPTIRNIGASSGGVTFEAAWGEIWQKFRDSMGSSASTLKDFGKSGLDSTKEGLNSAVDAVKNLDAKKATESTKNAARKTTEAVKDTGRKLQDAGKALGDGFKGLFK